MAKFSRLFSCPISATILSMLDPQLLVEFIADMLRTLLLEELSSRVRNFKPKPRLRGMAAVHRHVHRSIRRRLFNRLSTER